MGRKFKGESRPRGEFKPDLWSHQVKHGLGAGGVMVLQQIDGTFFIGKNIDWDPFLPLLRRGDDVISFLVADDGDHAIQIGLEGGVSERPYDVLPNKFGLGAAKGTWRDFSDIEEI